MELEGETQVETARPCCGPTGAVHQRERLAGPVDRLSTSGSITRKSRSQLLRGLSRMRLVTSFELRPDRRHAPRGARTSTSRRDASRSGARPRCRSPSDSATHYAPVSKWFRFTARRGRGPDDHRQAASELRVRVADQRLMERCGIDRLGLRGRRQRRTGRRGRKKMLDDPSAPESGAEGGAVSASGSRRGSWSPPHRAWERSESRFGA
jgi:hypothetical protein